MVELYEYNPMLITIEVIPTIDLKPQVPDALWSQASDYVFPGDRVQPLPGNFFAAMDEIMSGDIYQQLLAAIGAVEDIDA